MSLFLGKRETKFYELEDENMVSKFIGRRNKLRKRVETWKQRSSLEGSKGTKTSVGGDPYFSCCAIG